MVGRAGDLSGASYKALISFMMVPLLRLKHFPKVHLLILSRWALGFQHRNFNIGIQCTKHSDHSRYLGVEACSKLYSWEDSVKLVCVAESCMFEDDKRPIPAEKSYTQLRNHWALWMSVCLGRKMLQLFLLTSVSELCMILQEDFLNMSNLEQKW